MKELDPKPETLAQMSVVNFAVTLIVAETVFGFPINPVLDIATAIALANIQQVSKAPVIDLVKQSWKNFRDKS